MQNTIAHNRKARHDYQFVETYEAGLSLLGSEVKAIRRHGISLAEAFVAERNNELFLQNAYIAPYQGAQHLAHGPRRQRKLLLHRRQIQKIMGGITRKGFTAIPVRLYTGEKGWLKLEIALAVGMKKEDKREALKEKEWRREQHRVLKKNTRDSA